MDRVVSVQVHDLLGSSSAEELASFGFPTDEPADVAVLRLRALADDPLRSWVVEGTVTLLETLRGRLDGGGTGKRRLFVPVVWEPPGLGAAEHEAVSALIGAVRAVVHSATLESSASAVRCNVIVMDETSLGDATSALRFLASSDGAFAAGATFDVRASGR